MPASDPPAPPVSVRGRSAEADRPHVSSGHEGLAAVLEANLPHALEDSTWRLAAAARVRTLQGGETAFDQGESIPLVVVLEGYGAFRRTTVDGRHVIVGIAHPGGLHGIGAAAEAPAATTLIALTPAVVATWPGGVLRPILGRDPGLTLDLIDLVVARADRLTEAIEELLYSGARDRVLRVLARNRELFFGNPPLVSRTFLPSAVGISREMTGRVIRTLEREGLIARVGARGLTILAPGSVRPGRERLARAPFRPAGHRLTMTGMDADAEPDAQLFGWPPGWGFRPSTVEILERSSARVAFERGMIVAAAGSPRPLILVTDGYVAVRRTEPGEIFTLLVLRRGHVVAYRAGEVALADFVGLSAGQVALVPASAIRDLVERDPQFAVRMVDEASDGLRRVFNRLHEVTFDSAARRLAIALLAYEPLYLGARPELARSDLASLIGTSREMLGRLVHRFESLGAIERLGRSIIVRDRAALMELGAWDADGREHYEALRGPAADDPQFDA